MTKIKITIEIDVDFQKFFDDIPEGLYKEKEDVDEYYMLSSVSEVLHKGYQAAIQNHMNWMVTDGMKEHYPYAKHHIEIDQEVAKQIAENAKAVIVT